MMPLLLSVCLLVVLLPCPAAAAEIDDPLAAIYRGELRPSVENLIERHRQTRRYSVEDFPLQPQEFEAFRREIINSLAHSTGLREWVVRRPEGKQNALEGKFRDRVVKKFRHHGIEMEAHVIEIPETGDRIPAVLCLPRQPGRRPAVACFSGHSKNGLRDLVIDLDSYQEGVATRLAQAGFVTIAVEKFDTGYLSRTPPSGLDEEAITTFRLGTGVLTRSVQLMASLAALEILATHPRVDETRIGATGVSLGGWLSMQAALLSDRVAAVADFGRKTVYLPDEVSVEEFSGVGDLCHILPETFQLGDRNVLLLPYAPRPLLAGHGRRDKGSHEQAGRYFREPFERQYRALGKADGFRYHIHGGGDTMPSGVVMEYFQEIFGLEEQP